MADEDSSDSPFELVAKSADPTLNAEGEQIGHYDDENSDALGDEIDESWQHGLMNPSKLARTYQTKSKRKDKKTTDIPTFRDTVPSLLDSPEDTKEDSPEDTKEKEIRGVTSPNFSTRLQDLREHLDEENAPKSLDEYMSKCFSLKGLLRVSMFLIVIGGIYNVLSGTVPSKDEFETFKILHYKSSNESMPSIESWPLYVDLSYYKPNIERIKYKDYGVLSLARTVQKPGHYFVGMMNTWFPMPYLAPRSDTATNIKKKSKKIGKQHAWGVCMTGRCVCVPQVTPTLDFSKCQSAVWKKTWSKTVVYGGFVAGVGLYTLGFWEQFAVTFSSFVNPLYWFTFLTSPFLVKSYVDMASTVIFILVVLNAVQHQLKTSFRLWAIFFAGSYAYALGSFLSQWLLHDWGTMIRYRVNGVFGGLAAWLGFLAVVTDQPIFTWQFAEILSRPLSIRSRDLFFLISLLDMFESASIARLGGLGLAFYAGFVLHTFFYQPF